MKFIIPYIAVFAVLTGIGSCNKDFLDKNPLDQLSESTFWKTQSDADLALAGCYNFLCKGYNATSVTAAGAGWGGGTMFWDAITDNAYTQSSGGSFGNIATGAIEASTDLNNDMLGNAYALSYQAIAACNLFLSKIGKVSMDETVRTKYIGEVRFLRAYYYFLLTQLYGDLVLTFQPLGSDNASATLPRTAKAIVVDSIMADLDFAADHLPNTAYSGHVVRGTALGYKTKLLMANSRWQEAAATAQTIITENKFGLSPAYRDLFMKPGQNNNPEIMFSARYLPPNQASPSDWLYSYTNSVQVLKYLVDDYECTDGLPITSSPLYNAASPYSNRDPRLKLTVIVPGEWRGVTAATAFNPVSAAVPSGFLPRKTVDSTRFPTTYATQSDQDWVFLRYADILLMHAEAENEIAGPDLAVYDDVKKVRGRTGINMPQLPGAISQDSMRIRIRHERRIELALEGQRFFDLKRWRSDRTVIPTVKDPNNAYRTFPLRDTLWPVPQSEIDIANSYHNTGYKQTPGYN
jgi:hypothetical protein